MSFTVSVAGTEFHFPCEPDKSILNAAQRAGFELPFSCRKGVCGSCKGRIISGLVRAFTGDALSAAERNSGSALFCNTRPRSDLVVAPRRIGKADPFARKTVPARVFRLRPLASDVMLVHLRFPVGVRVKFKAGQHLSFILPDGERRDFSMANPPHMSDGAVLHIRRVPDGVVTGYIFEQLRHGDTLKVEVPFGDFALRDDHKPILFVAGSTGFAPIQSIIGDMLARGIVRQTVLYWGARDAQGLYSEMPAQWAQRYEHFNYVPVVSDAPALGLRHSLVHRAVLEDHHTLAGHQVYVCGSPAMTGAARSDFIAAGLAEDDFFADAFATRADAGWASEKRLGTYDGRA